MGGDGADRATVGRELVSRLDALSDRALKGQRAGGEIGRLVQRLPSRSGPQRTVLEITENGRAALLQWLHQPVDRVRDARSLLMLKLLFLSRRHADLEPLLAAQLQQFSRLGENLSAAAENAVGFDRALLLWRLQSTTAAIQFTETILAEGTLQRCDPAAHRGPA